MQGRHAGYTLIEVLVGILIFALGMMALAKLQGNLARNSGDANARTVATNIAEETIEAARTFGRIDSDGVNAAYNDIVDGTVTISGTPPRNSR
jgi:type IV pilus modification protein PilV